MKKLQINSCGALVPAFFAIILLFCFVSIVAETTSAQITAAKIQHAFKVKVTGKGQPMILIPGLSSPGEVWETTVARYKSNYECHVLTLAGFAGEPPLKTPSLEQVRDELITYIREKKLKKPVIVGHSLGGFMALWVATKEPDLVGKLVIVDGLPFMPAASIPNATVEMMKPQAEQMRKAIIAPQTPEQRLQMQTAILKTMITDAPKIELATKWGLASDNATVAQAMYEMFTTDLRSDLARIKSPTLVIGTWIGLQQYATREQVGKVFRDQFAKLSGYQFVMSETGRHFVMFDDPDTLFKAMDNFLAARK